MRVILWLFVGGESSSVKTTAVVFILTVVVCQMSNAEADLRPKHHRRIPYCLSNDTKLGDLPPGFVNAILVLHMTDWPSLSEYYLGRRIDIV